MTKRNFFVDNTSLHIFFIILLTFVYYCGSANNFFYADDFIWLYRVKHLANNWSSIFVLENRYFTPLTYISFYLNFKLFGLNPFWYHLQDIILHALNGILLYFLTYSVSTNKLTAFIAAIIFTTSSSILVTVLWPSARTDLIMVFFSLATIIAFIKSSSPNYKFIPIALYVLALCAKGTALVIPIILFMLISDAKPLKRKLKELTPYVAINMVYVALLMINKFGTNEIVPTHKMFSIMNIFKSLPVLIVPEKFLAGSSTLALIAFSILILIAFIVVNMVFNNLTIKIGTAMIVFGLLPLVFTRDYTLAGNDATAIHILSSPSNRIYLACVGISIVYAYLFVKIVTDRNRKYVRSLISILLAFLIYCNYQELSSLNMKWSLGTNNSRRDLEVLNNNSDFIKDDAIIFLYNFEGSTGFSDALVKTYFDVENIELHRFSSNFVNEMTDVTKSPLNNSQENYNIADAKLIMDCPGNKHIDELMGDGNLLLQIILADYRNLYGNHLQTEVTAIKNRLHESMIELRTVLNNCSK